MAVSLRKKAVEILINIEKNGAYINIEMNKLRGSNEFIDKDIRLIGEIVNGVIKRKITLDYIISKHSSTKLNKIAPFVLNVLRIGVYQIIFMDKIPDSAAVDECVKIIKKSSVYRLSGYVNAVLRSIDKTDFEGIFANNIETLSIKYSYPKWLIQKWVDNFGFDFAKELAESLNKKSPLYIRCSTLTNSISDFENKLKNSQIDYSIVKIDELPKYNYSFRINNVKDINLIPGFNDGNFYIQDPAASLAAFVLEPECGDTVIDVCAAPGGKSVFIADLMQNKGTIISCDIYDHKIKLIAQNAQKHKASCIIPTINDATKLNPDWVDKADRVLCDVPCSGFGIIRKKPDIKYAREEEDIKTLSQMGKKILEVSSRYLKKDGILVYSTCTIEKEENEDVINEFLNSHPEFSLFPFGNTKGFYTSYPNKTDTDGFFICRLKKNGVK